MSLPLPGSLLALLLASAAHAAPARVIVLDSAAERSILGSTGLQKKVRKAVGDPDAVLLPAIDVYQAGRWNGSEQLEGLVPGPAAGLVNQMRGELDAVAPLAFDSMSENDWMNTALRLKSVADLVYFVEDAGLRQPLFELYVQIGRAAENANDPVMPLFASVGGRTVNYYWYRAGAMAYEDPSLLELVQDPGVARSIRFYKDTLDSGELPMVTVSFEEQGAWDPKAFAERYQVFVNGVEVVVVDDEGLHRAPAGRLDIAVRRADGPAFSEKLDVDDPKETQRVMESGRRFVERLLRDPLLAATDACSVDVTTQGLGHLATYAALHPEAEVLLTLGKGKQLWRFDRGEVALAGDGCD